MTTVSGTVCVECYHDDSKLHVLSAIITKVSLFVECHHDNTIVTHDNSIVMVTLHTYYTTHYLLLNSENNNW